MNKISQNTATKNMEASLENDGCDICHGSGFIHPLVDSKTDYSRVITCVCMREKISNDRRKMLLKYCELPPMSEKMTFDNFKVYKEVRIAYETARDIAENTTGLHWVTFQGGNDTGKTHLAIAICKAWIEKGIVAKYAFVPLLLDELREGFRGEGVDSYQERFKRFCEVPLLVLDDLGAESTTNWVNEKLETLVDYRYMHNLSLVVTTNKSLDELSPRLESRLVRHPNAVLVTIMAKEYTLRRTLNK